MSSPEPLLSPTPASNAVISLGIPPVARSADAASSQRPSLNAANEELLPEPQMARRPADAESPVRVPLSAWLSLAFYAIGTALLFSLGVAYRLFA